MTKTTVSNTAMTETAMTETAMTEPAMTEPAESPPEAATEDTQANFVRLRGRLSVAPIEKVLPSGDGVWTFRVVVDRAAPYRRKQRVDALDCAVWTGRVRRSVATWREGDVVEVTGSLRRRFFRTPSGTVSRVEVEVEAGRVIRRADRA